MSRYVIDGLRPGTQIITPYGKIATHELGAHMSADQVTYLRDVLQYDPIEVAEPTIAVEIVLPNPDAIAEAEIQDAHHQRARTIAQAAAVEAQSVSVALPVEAEVRRGPGRPKRGPVPMTGPVAAEDL